MRARLFGFVVAASICGMARSVVASDDTTSLPDGQVMHLSFDRASGTTITDECNRTLSAELCGGAWIGSGGVSGNALMLNGTSAFARVSQNPTTSAVYTVSLWLRVPRAGLPSLHGANLFSYNRRYQIGFQVSGQKFMLYSYALNVPHYGYGAFEARSDPFVLPPDRWCHVAVVVYGGISYYMDGRMIGTLSGNGANSGDTEVLIGALNNDRSVGPRCFWPGAIDELRVFARALTADEVVAVMAEDAPGLAAERLASTYHLRDGRMFIREFQRGRDIERSVSTAEMRRIVQQFASPATPVAPHTGTNRATTVIGLSSAWDAPQDQNVFRRNESVHVAVADADYRGATNCLFSALLWQGATDSDEEIRRSVTMTNDASGAWQAVIPCAPFHAGEADMLVVGMDDTGRPVLMRTSGVTIQDTQP